MEAHLYASPTESEIMVNLIWFYKAKKGKGVYNSSNEKIESRLVFNMPKNTYLPIFMRFCGVDIFMKFSRIFSFIILKAFGHHDNAHDASRMNKITNA